MQAIKSLLIFALPKFIAQFYCNFRSEIICCKFQYRLSVHRYLFLLERPWLVLIKKNMLKFCCCLQTGPCWDYLCKWPSNRGDTE